MGGWGVSCMIHKKILYGSFSYSALKNTHLWSLRVLTYKVLHQCKLHCWRLFKCKDLQRCCGSLEYRVLHWGRLFWWCSFLHLLRLLRFSLQVTHWNLMLFIETDSSYSKVVVFEIKRSSLMIALCCSKCSITNK